MKITTGLVSDTAIAPGIGVDQEAVTLNEVQEGTMRRDTHVLANGAGFTIVPYGGSEQRWARVKNESETEFIELVISDGVADISLCTLQPKAAFVICLAASATITGSPLGDPVPIGITIISQ